MNEVPLPTWRDAPVDAAARDALHSRGLSYRTVAGDEVDGWLQSVARGFQDGERTEAQLAAGRTRNVDKRLTGVFDDAAPDGALAGPVATLASWIGDLALPGETAVPSWAISAVTVSPTHRRRGIARALLEGELRTAAAQGVPAAMLTVSESPLYGRYGFGVAAESASLVVDAKRANWIGPRPEGRVDFVSRADAKELFTQLHERTRLQAPGEITLPPGHEDRFTGTAPDSSHGGDVRCVRYTDGDGESRGVVSYRIRSNDDDFTKGTAEVTRLLADGADAYAALWRFVLELDLIGEVHVDLAGTDEPVLWMIDDRRAATVTVRDHQYVRILDVPAVLGARRYDTVGSVVLDVDDPLGLAAGRFLLAADGEGRGTVTRVDDAPDGVARVSLGIAELSAACLGGVSLLTLARAGRVRGADAGAARLLSWHVTPRLNLWY
ncbi:GNAT family N-acetyltransferase [uncultured Microbacterium sp.]|uniref:Acetyltransferase n=1 Tax=uncultured Microbacterium sp. TaxID=191216 RepID=A0A1Y5NUK0_9MICO|nr:GNAT family N-acetyltransferase [uncultured Microbacterium sp.]SBS70077.1 Acetyltransferase [uncultured Microbacterium sp.]